MKSKNNDIDAAMEWAFNNLLHNKYYCKAIDDYVLFTEGGIKHAIKAKTYPLKIKLIYKAVELLQTAELIDIQQDKDNRPNIKQIFVLKTLIVVDNEQKTVVVFLRQMSDGTIYYDHNVLK